MQKSIEHSIRERKLELSNEMSKKKSERNKALIKQLQNSIANMKSWLRK